MKLKVGIIGTHGLPGKYGGWEQLVNHLTNDLRDQFSFLVYTSSSIAEPGCVEYNGARLKVIKLKANGIQSIPYDIYSLIHAGFFCDVLFICGISGCIALPLIRLFRKKIILNPDGLEWKRKKWSRPIKLFLKISESLGIRFSDFLIADNKKIQDYIASKYKKEAILIEYGGDQVLNVPLRSETAKKYKIDAKNYAFTVCRIEPENNIHIILEAFKKKQSVKLVIVGNWNFSDYGKELRIQYNQYKNIKLLDPIYDQKALDELRSNCGIYIHGHSVGGTNPSLVEAMNLGLCIIAYNVEYNIETTENSAIFFSGKSELIDIIDDYENNRIDLSKYQVKMKEIALRRYSWKLITEKYTRAFLGL